MNTRKSKVLPIGDYSVDLFRRTIVAISPDGRFIAAGDSSDTDVRVWDVSSGTLLSCLCGHSAGILSVAFTPDGKGLVSGSCDGKLNYWELNMTNNNARNASGPFGKCILDLKGHKSGVFHIAISHNGQWIVSSSIYNGVRFWDKHGCAQLMLKVHQQYGARLCIQT